jgi:hypothetical protein
VGAWISFDFVGHTSEAQLKEQMLQFMAADAAKLAKGKYPFPWRC